MLEHYNNPLFEKIHLSRAFTQLRNLYGMHALVPIAAHCFYSSIWLAKACPKDNRALVLHTQHTLNYLGSGIDVQLTLNANLTPNLLFAIM